MEHSCLRTLDPYTRHRARNFIVDGVFLREYHISAQSQRNDQGRKGNHDSVREGAQDNCGQLGFIAEDQGNIQKCPQAQKSEWGHPLNTECMAWSLHTEVPTLLPRNSSSRENQQQKEDQPGLRNHLQLDWEGLASRGRVLISFTMVFHQENKQYFLPSLKMQDETIKHRALTFVWVDNSNLFKM